MAKKAIKWQELAESELLKLLRRARRLPGLVRLTGRPDAAWKVEVEVIGAPAMAHLNRSYRGKGYATDVLSFSAPEMFRKAGVLGELLICLPVLKRQAREQGHDPEIELQVLLIHGFLHLLGLDHEKGAREAAQMSRWEARLLPRHSRGLIGRSD